MDEDSSTEQKTWQVYSFGMIFIFIFFRLHLNESREGFCRSGRGRSFHVDGAKTEKAHFVNVSRKTLWPTFEVSRHDNSGNF